MTIRTFGPFIVSALMATLLAGCSVGRGSGEAMGKLYILNCSSKGDYCDSNGYCGTAAAPADYDLRPTFFVGEPIENLNRDLNGTLWTGSENRTNRLTIRLQRSGKQIENNETLFFDILDSYEVARCVRGREVIAADGTVQHDYDDRYCYRSSPTAPARIRISVVKGLIHAALSPRMSCARPAVATADDEIPTDGVVRPVADGHYLSWIEFADFGHAAQNDRPDPTTRTAVDPGFKIEMNQRLHARAFYLSLVDNKVEDARMKFQVPPDPDIGGFLAGWFDFDLTRGQGAQIFP